MYISTIVCNLPPGGVIIVISSERYGSDYDNYDRKLENAILRHERDGSWRREQHSSKPYHGPHNASVSILRVL